MENDDLEQCIDFILNRCTPKQLDVVIEAIERKKKSLSGALHFDAEGMSKKLSEQINASIQKSITGMTDSLRDFSADLIAREAPELSPEQASMLVDSWIPDMSFDGSAKPVARDGKISGLPVDLVYDMAQQFVSYGIGEMPAEKNEQLKNELGNWQETYWKKFPTKVQQTIKEFFDGKTTYGQFNKTLKTLLGL